MFINPGGPGDSGVALVRGDPAGFDALGGGRFDVVSWDPRGTNASTRVRCFRSQRSEARFWAGAAIPTTNAASERFRAQDRRSGAALRRGQRLAPAPHLDRRHRPRPRPPARPDRRGEAHLRRPLLRHLSRPDLRQPVPRPGPGDAARRHRRRGPSTRRGPRRGSPATSARPTRSSTSSSRSATAPDRSAARSPVGRQTAAERVERLFARVKRAPIPAPGCGRRSRRARSSATAICCSRSSSR